jgi:hypothetical protein
MLEHQKIVLKGVREDKALFKKELKKTINWLSEEELKDFDTWVRENFLDEHPDVIFELLSPRLHMAS